jgi:putative intracellular protease/amidase
MKTFVFLHDKYADWEVGFIMPELHMNGKEVHSFSLTKEPITSAGSLQVTPALGIDEVKPAKGDLVILCGGWFWKDFKNAKLDQFVKDARAKGAVIAAICDATGYLAQIGLLDQVKHTSNGLPFLSERAPQYRGKDLYQKKMAVCDQDVITAPGECAVDFTYEIMKRFELMSPSDCELWYKGYKTGEW